MSGRLCPDCGIERTRFDIPFCQVCRYNYDDSFDNPVTGCIPPSSDTVAPPPGSAGFQPAPDPTSSEPQSTDAPPKLRWVVAVTVDSSLYTDPDPNVPCPTYEPERAFHLDLAEILVGRPGKSKESHPDIPISDPGISHRHCKLLNEVDGSMSLLDVGSMNGTQLNGNEAPAGVKMSLKNGDQITLGCWTRITIRNM